MDLAVVVNNDPHVVVLRFTLVSIETSTPACRLFAVRGLLPSSTEHLIGYARKIPNKQISGVNSANHSRLSIPRNDGKEKG